MRQEIIGFQKDEERHWIAQLACGHNQHVRHNPPWINRPWVVTQAGRDRMLGRQLKCAKCRTREPVDPGP